MPWDSVRLDEPGGHILHYCYHHDPFHVKSSHSWEEDPSRESVSLPIPNLVIPLDFSMVMQVMITGGDGAFQNQHRIIMKTPPSMILNVVSLLQDRTLLNYLILLHCKLKIPSSTSCNNHVHLPLCLCHFHPYSLSHTMTHDHMQRGANCSTHHGLSTPRICWYWPRDERAVREEVMAY